MAESTGITNTQNHLGPRLNEDAMKLLAFEEVKALVSFYETVGWSPTMEYQILMDIIQTTEKDATRLKALKALQDRRAEIIKNSGLVVKATKTQKDKDGNQTVFTADVVASAFGGPREITKETRSTADGSEQNSTETEAPADDITGNGNASSTAAFHKPPSGLVTKPDREDSGGCTSAELEQNAKNNAGGNAGM